jgi:aryl-alcohol dehydrogenase
MRWNGQPIHGCFFGQSSFSNPTIVQETSCVPISAELPLEVLAPLGCGVQTGAGSIFNVVKPVESDTRSVVVFGIGGVGTAAIMAANAVHLDHPDLVTTIIAVDAQRDRLELAMELGATHTIHSSNPVDAVAEIHRITNGEGVDAAVDCTGAVPVINAMIGALSAGGIAVTVGVPSGTAEMSIQVFGFVNGCKTYRGSHQGNSQSRKVSKHIVK